MRKFIGTFVIVSSLVAVIGMFRGWFRASVDNQAEGVKVELRFNKVGIREDFDLARAKIGDLINGDSESQ